MINKDDSLNLNQAQKIRLILVVLIGAFIGVLNQTLLTTNSPKIIRDFSITSSTAQWIATIFC